VKFSDKKGAFSGLLGYFEKAKLVYKRGKNGLIGEAFEILIIAFIWRVTFCPLHNIIMLNKSSSKFKMRFSYLKSKNFF
jgi:hypothetical protein